jgi:hypothetical protein
MECDFSCSCGKNNPSRTQTQIEDVESIRITENDLMTYTRADEIQRYSRFIIIMHLNI